MNAVIVEAEADQQSIQAEHALDVGDDRDRGPRSDEGGFAPPFLGQRPARRGERRHAPIERDRWRARMADEIGAAVGRQPGTDEIPERVADAVGILVVDEPKRYLGRTL